MNEISIHEAKKRLMGACPALYAYAVLDLNNYEGETENSYAYESHGAIIIKKWWSNSEYSWLICDVGNSDMIAAMKEPKEAFNNQKLSSTYFIGNIPENYDTNGKWVRLKFACTSGGKTYDDTAVRVLTEENREQMILLTTVPEDDSNMAKMTARGIKNDYDYARDCDIQMLGIFDGTTLAGAVSVADRWGELFHINNIFISRNYRGRKYATRLINTATGMHPGIIYTYDCNIDNFASIASAKSAGYILTGTFILYNG